MVIGASSSDAIALATANRSPDGQPAQRLRVGDPHVALGEQGAQHRGELGPRGAAAEPEQRRRRLRRRRRGPRGVSGTGARSTSPAAPARRGRRAARRPGRGRRRPRRAPARRGGSAGSSTRVVDDDAADLAGASASPCTRSSRVAPRSSRTRPRLARGAWGSGPRSWRAPADRPASDRHRSVRRVSHSVAVVTSARRVRQRRHAEAGPGRARRGGRRRARTAR